MSTSHPPSDPGEGWRRQPSPGPQWQPPPPPSAPFGQPPAGPGPRYGAEPYGNQPPTYGGPDQPGYGQWPGQPQWQQPAKPPSKVGPILVAVGAVMMVAGVILGISVGRDFLEIVPSPGDVTPVVGETFVQIDDGETMILYAPSSMMPVCDIVGPTEAVPDIDLGGANYQFPLDNVNYESMARIGGPGEPIGEYIVMCEEEGLIVAPPLDVGDIVSSVGGLLLVIALGGVGFTLLVVGLIMWLLSRRRA